MFHFFYFFLALGQFLNIRTPTIVAYSTNCWITLSCFFSHTELIFFIFSFDISSSESTLKYVKSQPSEEEKCTLCRSTSSLALQWRSSRFLKVLSPRKGEKTLLRDHRRLNDRLNTRFAESCFWESVLLWIYLLTGAFFLPLSWCNYAILFLTIPRNLFLTSNILTIIEAYQNNKT